MQPKAYPLPVQTALTFSPPTTVVEHTLASIPARKGILDNSVSFLKQDDFMLVSAT